MSVVTFDSDPRTEQYSPPPLAGRVDRLSLVWWRTGLDDANPLFAPVGAGDVRTLVAVWPTYEDGLPRPGELAEVLVRWWTLSQPWFEHLRARHAMWHLGRHDLLVNDRFADPCADSLVRRARASKHPAAARVDVAVRELLATIAA